MTVCSQRWPLAPIKAVARPSTAIFLCAAALLSSLELPAAVPPQNTGRILIQPKPGTEKQLAAFHRARGVGVLRSFDTMGRVQILLVPAKSAASRLIAEYQRSGLVEFAEPDYVRHTNLAPNDPKYVDGTLWGLNNFGQNGGTAGADIHAPAAWDILTSAGDVVVAILDTGIRYTHQDLAANIWANPADGTHGTNSIGGTTNPNDDSTSGHGTIMAGVIGAVGNNGLGITGVAWDVKMMACKCFDANGQSSDSAIIAAMDFARAHGARVISASFDGPGFGLALSNAIYSVRNAGIIFVASAGNNALNIDLTPRYPSCYDIDNIVSVAYFTRTGALGILSNYGGTNVDLAAPGDQIYSTVNTSDSAYFPPSGLGINVAGTSYAAAYVSGALALLRAKYPAETHTQIIERLLRAAEPVPELAGKCVTGGRLNLRDALCPPIPLLRVSSSSGGNFTFQVSTTPNRACVIEATTAPGSWSPVFTNTTDALGTFEFTDSLSTGIPARFYRASASP